MRIAHLLAALAIMTLAPNALAQSQPSTPTSTTAPAPTTAAAQLNWQGLPFSSLADFEAKVPIGMTIQDLVHTLGQPAAITPGQESDQVYHYAYRLSGGGELDAVIITRSAAVFIRRLYTNSQTAGIARVN